jgi:WD repeat-containing protein 90
VGTPARTPASITGHPVRVERHSAPKPRPPSAGGASPGHVSFADVSPGTAATVLGAKKACAILPDPVMELQHVMGMSGEHARALAWCPGTAEAVFVSNNMVVAQDTVTGVQRFFMGHTAPVVAIAFSGDGQLMATAQEGKTALVRLWNMATGQCAAILCGHASGLAAIDVSQDGRAVVAVGMDVYKRQTLVVWDVSRVLQGDKATPIVKHTTDFNVRCVKFSPFEEDRLWTCGVDSIRCYRLKNGQLRGISVQLGEHRHTKRVPAGPYADDLMRNTFTDLAFEAGHGLMELHEKHIFVASVSGAVFQLNYGRRCLECVYQLHNAAINSLVVSEGFCVTASDDKFLRVWPVDFTDFFLEAEHEAAITSVGVSGDGLQLAVGTENGSVRRSHASSTRTDPTTLDCPTFSRGGTVPRCAFRWRSLARSPNGSERAT